MALHVLSAREVQTARDGDHSDGGGLILRVRGSRVAWVFRYTSPGGRRRDAGFGTAHRDTVAAAGESLRLARERASKAREALAGGLDPLDEKRTRKATDAAAAASKKAAVKAEATTLARVTRDYHARTIEPVMNAKYATVWLQSLELHVPASIWHKPITEVGAVELFEALSEVKGKLPETGNRVRRRLAEVFDDAIFRKLCASNPAAVIRKKLSRIGKPTDRHYAALAFEEVPAFVRALRLREGSAALALEFGLLTAARTGEILGATWDEIDDQTAVWRVPAARMKGGEEHFVHLSPRALEILKAARAFGSAYLFPSPINPDRPLSNMSMLTLLKRLGYAKRTTVHGVCRASFSTWANETDAARPDAIEACLAHKEADRVRRAYNRAGFAAERAALLRAWTDFCDGRKLTPEQAAPSANVLPMTRAA